MARSSRWKDQSGGANQPVDPASVLPPAATPPGTPAPAGMQPPVGAAAYPQPAVPQPAPAAPPAPPAGQPVVPSAAPAASSAGGEVAELRSTLAGLQATVAALVERTAAAPAPGGNSDTDQASRIIVMANRAAESTIEDARGEADAILAAAKAQSFEIIRMARELANQELAAERARVADATQAWLTRRHEVAGELRTVEQMLLGYRSGLDSTSESLRSAVTMLESESTDLPVIEALPSVVSEAVPGVEAESPSEPVIDLTDAAPVFDTPLAAEPVSPFEPGHVEEAAPRTNLFGGPLVTDTPQPPSWPAPVAAEVVEVVEVEPEFDEPDDEPASTNLRPGLFGR